MSRGIVFLFSESSSKSHEIRKELSIGGSMDVPVFPVRLSPITPTGALRYELAIRQWIDIFPDRRRALGALAETIKKVLNASATAENPGTTALAVTAPVDSCGRAAKVTSQKTRPGGTRSHRRARHSGI